MLATHNLHAGVIPVPPRSHCDCYIVVFLIYVFFFFVFVYASVPPLAEFHCEAWFIYMQFQWLLLPVVATSLPLPSSLLLELCLFGPASLSNSTYFCFCINVGICYKSVMQLFAYVCIYELYINSQHNR